MPPVKLKNLRDVSRIPRVGRNIRSVFQSYGQFNGDENSGSYSGVSGSRSETVCGSLLRWVVLTIVGFAEKKKKERNKIECSFFLKKINL